MDESGTHQHDKTRWDLLNCEPLPPLGHVRRLEELDIRQCTSLRLVFPSQRSVEEPLDTSITLQVLLLPFRTWAEVLMTLTLMACPSLMAVHLTTTCGHMQQVSLSLDVQVKETVLVLKPVGERHLPLWGTIIIVNLGT